MKLRNREVTIFNMSALDLFAGALGAFIVLAVIALPYFANTHRLDDESLLAELGEEQNRRRRAEADLAQTREELAQCGADRQRESDARESAETQLEQCRQAAQANFLLTVISWRTSDDDVDLHITDPEGREFYYAAREHTGSQARFEEDNLRGPGNEIWLHPDVTPGTYRVEYVLYSHSSGDPVNIRGAALHRDGRHEFTDVVLGSVGERRDAARINVAADGSVSLVR